MSAPVRLPVAELITEAFRLGRLAIPKAGRDFATFAIVGGIFAWRAPETGPAMGLFFLAALFITGVRASSALYQAMLPGASPVNWKTIFSLAHANAALYLAFAFIGVFVAFFLAILPGIFLKASGADVDASTDPSIVQAELMKLLPTPYGWLWIVLSLAGLGGLAFLALRLLLSGAATVRHGKAHVFLTWPLTRGHALTLGLASLATHVLPYLVAFAVIRFARTLLESAAAPSLASLATGIFAIVALIPFFALGHGLAVATLRRLQPD